MIPAIRQGISGITYLVGSFKTQTQPGEKSWNPAKLLLFIGVKRRLPRWHRHHHFTWGTKPVPTYAWDWLWECGTLFSNSYLTFRGALSLSLLALLAAWHICSPILVWTSCLIVSDRVPQFALSYLLKLTFFAGHPVLHKGWVRLWGRSEMVEKTHLWQHQQAVSTGPPPIFPSNSTRRHSLASLFSLGFKSKQNTPSGTMLVGSFLLLLPMLRRNQWHWGVSDTYLNTGVEKLGVDTNAEGCEQPNPNGVSTLNSRATDLFVESRDQSSKVSTYALHNHAQHSNIFRRYRHGWD